MSVYGVQLQIGADAKICIAPASVRVHAEKLTLYGVGLINYAGHHTALTLQQLERGGNAVFARLESGETGAAYRGVLALLIDPIAYGVGNGILRPASRCRLRSILSGQAGTNRQS